MKLSIQHPTYEHQFGRGKLLGEHYAVFLRQTFPESFADFSNLDTLLTSFRAYIVLDDFLFDNHVEPRLRRELVAKCDSLIRSSRRVLSENKVSDHIIDDSLSIIQSAKSNFALNRPIDSVLEKCWFVFTPLELISSESPLKAKATLFLKEYLGLIQIADDFQDIDEDRHAPINHNVLVTDPELVDVPSSVLQCLLAADFVRLGLRKTRQWQAMKLCSETARKYIEYAHRYFQDLNALVPGPSMGKFYLAEDYCGSGRAYVSGAATQQLRKLALCSSGEPAQISEAVLSRIRAEAIHRSE